MHPRTLVAHLLLLSAALASAGGRAQTPPTESAASNSDVMVEVSDNSVALTASQPKSDSWRLSIPPGGTGLEVTMRDDSGQTLGTFAVQLPATHTSNPARNGPATDTPNQKRFVLAGRVPGLGRALAQIHFAWDVGGPPPAFSAPRGARSPKSWYRHVFIGLEGLKAYHAALTWTGMTARATTNAVSLRLVQ